MITYNITKSDLQARAKSFDYVVRILDGEIEAYPKGLRGDASYFTDDDQDGRREVIQWFRADRDSRFAARLVDLPITEDQRQALIKWHAYHGKEWLENLLWKGWFSGRYEGFGNDWEVTSSLQTLRNNNGHEVLASFAK